MTSRELTVLTVTILKDNLWEGKRAKFIGKCLGDEK